MTPQVKRLVAGAFGILLAVTVASGCDSTKSIGNSTGDKIKQGGDAGGSTGYP